MSNRVGIPKIEYITRSPDAKGMTSIVIKSSGNHLQLIDDWAVHYGGELKIRVPDQLTLGWRSPLYHAQYTFWGGSDVPALVAFIGLIEKLLKNDI